MSEQRRAPGTVRHQPRPHAPTTLVRKTQLDTRRTPAFEHDFAHGRSVDAGNTGLDRGIPEQSIEGAARHFPGVRVADAAAVGEMEVLGLGAVLETEVGAVLPQEARFLETLIEAELAPDRQRSRKQALADAETRMAALLDDQHSVAAALEQASKGGAGRATADDHDVVTVTDRRDLGHCAGVAVHPGSLVNARPLDQR